jgi:hypothetical protein
VAQAYLDDFVQELKRMGEVAFRRRHINPVLVVTGKAGRGMRAIRGTDEVTRVTELPAPRRAGALALMHRVFPVVKAIHAPMGPVSLGRTSENDVTIPEYSISKRHCTFELRDGMMAINDCGSTNGTMLNGTRLQENVPVPLCGGELITMGRFTFLYETPAGFLEMVSELVK